MRDSKSLTGHIIVPQPKSRDPFFFRGVILVADHKPSGAWGLMVNKPTKTLLLSDVMQAAGIDSERKDKIFIGGPVEPNRVNIIHSLDWSSLSTLKINNDIGITNDISVLAAIQEGFGPVLYRTCIGVSAWAAGQLDAECQGESPWRQEDRWLYAPATIESIFNLTNDEQWEKCIDIVAKNKISTWL
jgi:putative transcriptional regulator